MNFTYLLLIAIAVVFTYRNFKLTKQYRKEKAFVDAYQLMLQDNIDAYDSIKACIDSDLADYIKVKANTLLAYMQLEKGEDPKEIIEALDYSILFKNKGKFDVMMLNRNCDIFIWLIMLIARSKKYKKTALLKVIETKVKELENDLDTRVEYKLLVSAINQVSKKTDEENFFEKLLEGDYVGLGYEKHYIGLYKKIASAFLLAKGSENEEYKEDTKQFSSTMVGKKLLQDLDIYEQYKIEEEIKEEIEVKETKKKTVKKATKKAAAKKTVKKETKKK